MNVITIVEAIDQQAKVYYWTGVYFLVHQDKLYQIDHDTIVPFQPGNEVFRNLMNRMKTLKPVPRSEAKQILENLYHVIKELKQLI